MPILFRIKMNKMPHLAIKLLEGKTEEQKKKLAAELVKTAQSIIGYGDESYSVSIEDFSWDDWQKKVYPEEIMERKEILYKKPGYTV
ncbi:MAG: 4-oxalocrotonate tautomerase [Pseudopedobacter saltans]|uniref:4-oxalocrotonate tautomerase n=1 Tax=Pseudopedobacter saltans TaxID=151895 RepID=A0A2W5GXQ4_9SPHI|nr:MAG: 4-oxalocrotonate tautomerase [Pseudopedobacter saltans]